MGTESETVGVQLSPVVFGVLGGLDADPSQIRGACAWAAGTELPPLTGTVDGMDGRFRPGDHLRVRRPLGYNHHGIYVSDGRVIELGSGITLTDKSGTGIDAVPLSDFENGGTAKVVRHG